MQLNEKLGIISPARYVWSPNYNERPPGIPVDLLVIHGISLPEGQFGTSSIDALFCNQLSANSHPSFAAIVSLKVSSHLLINRAGELTQYVPLNQRAWHAGASVFEGRENCNDFSIGIELEGTDHIPYTPEQYATLVKVTQLIQRYYPLITTDRIVGHSMIAPGRKTDPGEAFDWEYYKNQV